jgi:glycosyltransferase involved in cell wall biosynthesis
VKIAVLCTDQGVRVPDEKGASLHLLAITRAFAREGHEVLLVGVRGHDDPPDDLETFLLPHPGRATGIERERNKLALVEQFVREAGPGIDRFSPDVVYERLALFGTAGVRLAAQVRAFHVVEVNALMAREEARWRGLELASVAIERERQVLVAAHAVVPVSEQWRREIVEVISDAKQAVNSTGNAKVQVVPNGFDEVAFSVTPQKKEARIQFGLPAEGTIAVFTGSLRPWHGVDLAIRALSFVSNTVHLVIAGDGEIKAELQALTETLGLANRIHWLGHVAHADIPALLSAADVALAPYPALDDFAFSPLKLYEYLAVGVPIVASDIGQISDLLADIGSAELVEPGNVAALAAAITRVVSDPNMTSFASLNRATTLLSHGWNARAAQIVRHVEAIRNAEPQPSSGATA